MPHVVIEYSSNLAARMDVERFLKTVHEAVVATGVFPVSAIRIRGVARDCYMIADGHPDNAFVHIVLRMRPGRDPAVKRRAAEEIFSAVTGFLSEIYSTSPLGITFEVQEVDVDNRFMQGNLETYVAQRSLERQSQHKEVT